MSDDSVEECQVRGNGVCSYVVTTKLKDGTPACKHCAEMANARIFEVTECHYPKLKEPEPSKQVGTSIPLMKSLA